MIASKGYYAKETGVFIPIELKQGDRVMYNPFAGGVIKFEGEPYLLMDEKEIKLKIN
jgi:chaperonin GroES